MKTHQMPYKKEPLTRGPMLEEVGILVIIYLKCQFRTSVLKSPLRLLSGSRLMVE